MNQEHRDPTQDEINHLLAHDFYKIGRWYFVHNGTIYDLSAADLNQLDEIVKNHRFVVTVTADGKPFEVDA